MRTREEKRRDVWERDKIVKALRAEADKLWHLAKVIQQEDGVSDVTTALKNQSTALHARCVEIEHLELG